MKKKITKILIKLRKRIPEILMVFFIIILVCSVTNIICNRYENKMEEQRLEELKNVVENPEKLDIVETQLEEETEIIEIETEEEEELIILPEYEELYSENSDFIGWIKIDDTSIDYPVMQTSIEEPTFYIHKDWEKNYSKKGIPFIDAWSILGESRNLIIYGHNMKDGTMFGPLKNYKEKSFYDEHQIIKFDTIYEKSDYQIISVLLAQVFYVGDTEEVRTDVSDNEFVFYNYSNINSEEQFDEYISQIKERSLYDTGVTAEYGDNLITLCTCSYHVKDGRLLVVAKKIQ